MAKFFRVAKEGATADGRQIKGEHLEQMAKNYNVQKYQARIWIEHLRTVMPDGTFKAYGDVAALKTEKDTDGKTVLLAQIEPTDDLKAINKNHQKLYSSVEIDTSFADTGEAYLVGLAVTDSPASLGTERLMFSVTQKEPEHLFSQYSETQLPTDDGMGILEQVKGFLSKFTKDQETAKTGEKVELSQELGKGFEMVINHFNSEIASQKTAFDAALKEQAEKYNAQIAELKGQFTSVQDTLDTTPANAPRPQATGATNFTQTDC